ETVTFEDTALRRIITEYTREAGVRGLERQIGAVARKIAARVAGSEASGAGWTEVGGDVLFVEARLLPSGHGNLILTGQLGNVMQESARAAVSHIRAQTAELGIPANAFDGHDL